MAKDDRPSTPATGVATASEHDAAAQFGVMLRGSLFPTLAAALVVVAVSAVWGAEPVWSAAVGAALVVVFFSLSLLVMKATAHLEPTAVMAVVLGVYTGKLLLLGIALVLLHDASWLNGQALGTSVVVCTVVWLAFEMRAFTKMRVLVAGSGTGSRS